MSYIISAIIVLVIIGAIAEAVEKGKKKNGKSPNRKSSTLPRKVPTPDVAVKMLNREGDKHFDSFRTYIAGVHHHVNESFIGSHTGIIANQKDNKYDSRAMGIYLSGRLMGYIPARELDDFWEWSDGKPVPCAAYIYKEDGELRGRVKAFLPCNADFISEEVGAYLSWVVQTYGSDFMPKNQNISFRVEDAEEIARDNDNVKLIPDE